VIFGHRGEVASKKRGNVGCAASEVAARRRDARANLAPTMNDRSQIPIRYPICSAVTTAIAINAIDHT